MKLPNSKRAVIDLAKLTDYCLNPRHPRGRHKARVFAAALGIKLEHAELLRTSLFTAAENSIAIPIEKDEYGQRYILDFQMVGHKGQAIVRSSWIVLQGENFARFLSCYVL